MMRAAKAALPRITKLPIRAWLSKRTVPGTVKPESIQRSSAGWKAALLFGILFFIGYLSGIGEGRAGSSEFGAALASYYTDSANFAAVSPLFMTLFGAAFLQAVLVFLCGFSALGSLFLGTYFAARGAVLGLCAAGVFVSGGTRGLVVHWMLTCLPDMGVFLVMLWLAVRANQCAVLIFRSLINAGGHVRSVPPLKALLIRFAVALLLAAAVCLFGAASGVVFAGVLL